VRAGHWPVRLAVAAEADLHEILRWTVEHFGEKQSRAYANTLAAALEELSTGPKLSGVRARSDIANGLFTLHVARHGRKGRHFVMFRIGHDERGEVIEVLPLLDDAMDLPSHVPPLDEST
jgi:toxin ParE1/3/4